MDWEVVVRHVVLVALVACGWQDPLGAPDDLAADAPDGQYHGELMLEVRAFAGPIRVKRETCVQPFVLKVDTSSDVRGRVTCDMGELGTLDVVLRGEVAPMPYVGGDLETPEFSGGWDGWFYDGDRVYGETVGETRAEGLRVEWFGWFDAQHQDSAGVGGAVIGG